MTRIEGWARDGLTDAQIADKMGIAAGTLYAYQNDHPEILDALKRGKAPVDTEVENALLKRARGGFEVKETRIERWTDKDGKLISEHTVEIMKEVPPDTTAQIFWLKNRKPEEWREKREIVAEVKDAALRNMQTIAALINDPEPDVSIEELEAGRGEDA